MCTDGDGVGGWKGQIDGDGGEGGEGKSKGVCITELLASRV